MGYQVILFTELRIEFLLNLMKMVLLNLLNKIKILYTMLCCNMKLTV